MDRAIQQLDTSKTYWVIHWTLLSTVWSIGARGLFLKSPEKFSGLKSQLSNCSVLLLKSESLKMFFKVRKTKRIAMCDGSVLWRYKGNCDSQNEPKKFWDFWQTGPRIFFNRLAEMKKIEFRTSGLTRLRFSRIVANDIH